MKPGRLAPILLALVTAMAGVIALEWMGRNVEARDDEIYISHTIAVDGDDGAEDEQSWQAARPVNDDHARARQLLRRGALDEALPLYAAVVRDHEQPALLAEVAYALRRAGRCSDAVLLTSRAVDLAQDDGSIQLAHALTQRCVGNDDATRNAFEAAIRARPHHTLTRMAYGSYLRRRGALDDAVRVLEPAAATGSNDERAQASALLGRCLFERGDAEAAEAALTEAIERAPASVSTWIAVARTYVSSDAPGDLQAAHEHAVRAVRLAPSYAPAYSVLGRALEKLGDELGAIDAYRNAADLDDTYVYVRKRLVRLGLSQEEFALAARAAEELIALDPDAADVHLLQGLAEARRGNAAAARSAYRRAIDVRDGDYAEAWYNLGLLEREAGQTAAAIDAYEAAIAARPDYASAWNNLGLAHGDNGDDASAEAAFREAIRLRPSFGAAWSNLGRLLAARDAYDEALIAYQRAHEADPDNRVTRLRLAVAQRRVGDDASAIATYERLVRDEPRYAAAWYNLGLTLAGVDRIDEARRAFRNALAIDPSHHSARVSLGRLEMDHGDADAALEHLTLALDQDPTDSLVRLRIARLHRRRGAWDDCVHEAEAILGHRPNYRRAITLRDACRHRAP